MQQPEKNILEPLLLDVINVNVIPQWIKVFCWFFMIFGAFSVLIFLLGLLGMNIQLSLYGISSSGELNFSSIIILSLFIIKGIVAFGLLTKKTWAVRFGIIDALGGILICVSTMLLALFNLGPFALIRLELALLIPYLLKLIKLNKTW